jgi:hypothetical protein
VKTSTEHGAVVVYDGYGNEEHVCLEHLKIEVAAAAPAAAAGSSAAGSAAEGGGVEVPHHLVVLPTDSEEVRLSKVKRQKSIKRKAKEALTNKADADKQTKWQAFQATAKRVKGALTDIGAKSQFSVATDDVHARVGVVTKRD